MPTNAAPSRNDSLQAAPGENRTQENPEFVPETTRGKSAHAMTARRLKWLSFVPEALLPFLTGCGGSQSVLNPQGVQAVSLAKLFWIFTGVCGAIWILVMIALAILRSLERRERSTTR